MQQANNLLKTAALNMPSNSQTTQRPQTFSEEEKDLTGYFWLRMSNLYGAAKMQATWPDEKTLKLAKMEYAKTIGRFNRERIHEAFEHVKRERQAGNEKFEWPNVDAILGVLTKEGQITGTWGTGAHRIFRKDRRLEDEGAKQRAAQAGAEELERMKELLA